MASGGDAVIDPVGDVTRDATIDKFDAADAGTGTDDDSATSSDAADAIVDRSADQGNPVCPGDGGWWVKGVSSVRRLFAVSYVGVEIADASTWKLIRQLRGFDPAVLLDLQDLAVAPSGDRFFVASAGGVRAFDSVTGSQLASTTASDFHGTYTSLAMAPDGSTLYARGDDGIYALDPATLATRDHVVANGGSTNSLSISPDGCQLVIDWFEPPGVGYVRFVNTTPKLSLDPRILNGTEGATPTNSPGTSPVSPVFTESGGVLAIGSTSVWAFLFGSDNVQINPHPAFNRSLITGRHVLTYDPDLRVAYAYGKGVFEVIDLKTNTAFANLIGEQRGLPSGNPGGAYYWVGTQLFAGNAASPSLPEPVYTFASDAPPVLVQVARVVQ